MPVLLAILFALGLLFMVVPSAKQQAQAEAQKCRMDLPPEQNPDHCVFR